MVSGSWCGYEMEPMELVEGTEATYRAYMKMGETGRERFSFCLNKKKAETIAPAVDNAHEKIHVSGPGAASGVQGLQSLKLLGMIEGSIFLLIELLASVSLIEFSCFDTNLKRSSTLCSAKSCRPQVTAGQWIRLVVVASAAFIASPPY